VRHPLGETKTGLVMMKRDTRIEAAVESLLLEFAGNAWFTESFWPENEQRVRLILADILRRLTMPARLLDVGCFNGFLSLLIKRLGYEVAATDAVSMPERDEMLARQEIEFFYSNLNVPRPFEGTPEGRFDAVIMGEVIEHVLNHPLGLMREIARILRARGLLVITTPNPSTAINAFRVLTGRASLWGTRAFLELPKIVDGQVTDIGDVHFREYRTSELAELVTAAGFAVDQVRYFAFGTSPQQPLVKRWLKGNVLGRLLMRHRLFGATQYLLATRV
jgi:2-polyprenyl-3-methyl-5-hydroxy-6-metoxy-1,4-benzoquinol methylase